VTPLADRLRKMLLDSPHGRMFRRFPFHVDRRATTRCYDRLQWPLVVREHEEHEERREAVR